MAARDQGLGDRRRAIAFGIADIGREARDRRDAKRDLRRQPVATGRGVDRCQLVVVVADGADELEPGRIVLFQLHEAAGYRALAARRRDVGIAAGIEGLDIVAEGI